VVLVIVATLLAMFIGAVYPLLTWVSGSMESSRLNQMMMLAETISLHIEEDMLFLSADHMGSLIEAFHAVSDFETVKVARVDGMEAFRDLATMERVAKLTGKTPYHRAARETRRVVNEGNRWFAQAVATGETVTYTDAETGRATLFAPLPNEPQCHSCHAAHDRVRGVVVIVAAGEKKLTAFHAFERFLFMGVALILLVTGGALWWAMSKMVIRPVERMVSQLRRANHVGFPEPLDSNADDEIGELADTINRLSDRLKTSFRDLERTKTFLDTTLSSLGEGVVVLDRDFRIQLANRFVCQLMKADAEEIVGKRCHELIHHRETLCDDCAVIHTFNTGEPAYTRHSGVAADGSKTYVELSSFPIFDETGAVRQVIEKVADISLRLELEDKLRQSEKLAAVGMLTSGLAHEIGNPLTAVSNLAQAIERKTDDDYTSGKIKLMRQNLDRIENIIREFLNFSRPERFIGQMADVPATLRAAARLAEWDPRFGKTAIVWSIDGALPLAALAADSLFQVALNLFFNALDAMEDHPAPRIEVGVILKDGFLTITVKDNGKGMTEKQRQNLFQPFFTTKQPGKGMGLGLFITYGIVQRCGGDISIHSTPGAGATAVVRLPGADRRRKEL
jgi:PAS domain S-box-containing protein